MGSLPDFATFDLNSLDEYYETQKTIQGGQIKVDLNFEAKSLKNDQLKTIQGFIENIDRFNNKNQTFIHDNLLSESGETANYLAFFLEELAEEIGQTIDLSQEKTTQEKALLKQLKLIRVGLYPDGKYNTSHFGIFDYTIMINDLFHDQLLVVKTDEHGNLNEIVWES